MLLKYLNRIEEEAKYVRMISPKKKLKKKKPFKVLQKGRSK
jgi:hypothetical protein